MGLSLNKQRPYYGCFRNQKHRGRDPKFLIAALLGISITAAEAYTKSAGATVDDFDSAVARLHNGEPAQAQYKAMPRSLLIPAEFRLFSTTPSTYEARFHEYLTKRGFTVADLAPYELQWALVGPQAYRIIFPIYDEGLLVGWTGRGVRPGTIPRYKASDNLGKDVLLKFPGHETAEYVVLVEGPFDALKIDVFGRAFGVSAVATMGTAVTEAQVRAIIQIARQHHVKKVAFLFDPDAYMHSFALLGELQILQQKIQLCKVPEGFEDPGAMDAEAVNIFCKSIASDD